MKALILCSLVCIVSSAFAAPIHLSGRAGVVDGATDEQWSMGEMYPVRPGTYEVAQFLEKMAVPGPGGFDCEGQYVFLNQEFHVFELTNCQSR